MNDSQLAAMVDELEKIKEAGLLSGMSTMFQRGSRALSRATNATTNRPLFSNTLKSGPTLPGTMQSIGRRSHWDVLKRTYKAGAGKDRGMLGGLKALAKSDYGALAGSAGALGLAGYGAYKAAK